jgi:pilus assembly protein CpaC
LIVRRLLATTLTSLLVVTTAGGAEKLPAPSPSLIRIEREIGTSRELFLEVGQNKLMETSAPLGRVSVADPQVADLKVVTNSQVLLTAKGVGDTYVTLWDKSDRAMVMSVHITRNLDGLRRQLKDLFPEENIQVSAAGELVVLSGEVSDVRLPERILSVARLHSTKIANLLHVKGQQQVQLEVKFAEVNRGGLRQMGVNAFHQTRYGGPASGFLNPGAAIDSQALAPDKLPTPTFPAVQGAPFRQAFNLFYSQLGDYPFSAVVSLLENNALAKTLAEPTLVAMSGQEAKFHAGGEFPIPISQAFGNIMIEFKKFGIMLKFVPTVVGEGTINLSLNTEVSEMDASKGITIGNLQIPGLTKRESQTTVRLRDGQSFAIAGLLSDNVRSNVDRVPGLGNLPVLGALFRSTSYQRNESELLVVVTAHLVRPMGPGQAPIMPGQDELNDPSDLELFLLGKVSGSPRLKPARGEAVPVSGQRLGPVGDLGFIR